MKSNFIFCFLFCLQMHLFAQMPGNGDSTNNWDWNCGSKIYYSLEEASKANPDSVLCLHLGNTGLKKFPMEVLKYKNLRRLNFGNLDLLDQLELTPWLLSKEEKAKVAEIWEKHKYAGDRGIHFYFPTKNRTKVRKVPKEIKQLNNLKQLCFNGSFIFYKRKLRRVQKLLPSCEIDIET